MKAAIDSIYEQGREAFLRGKRNPPKALTGHQRVRWYDGWYDTSTERKCRWTRDEWGDKNQLERSIERIEENGTITHDRSR